MVRGMSQNERDDLAIYLGLQDFEVALVEVEASAPPRPDQGDEPGPPIRHSPLSGLRA